MQLKYSGKTKIAQERHISNIKKPVKIGVKADFEQKNALDPKKNLEDIEGMVKKACVYVAKEKTKQSDLQEK